MPESRYLIRALRKEDFLDLTFEVINVHAEGTPARLVRTDRGLPSLLIVHFAPQHVAEEVFKIEHGTPQDGSPPVRAMLAGPSRLVFRLPDGADSWPLSLPTLLDWQAYWPVLAPNALPPNVAGGPGGAVPTPQETALELPTGLYLSPDETGSWLHSIDAVQLQGRFALWHTKLAARLAGAGEVSENLEVFVRAIAAKPTHISFRWPLTAKDLDDIARLSSDFSLPSLEFTDNRFGSLQNLEQHLALMGVLPIKYLPKPIRAQKLILSPLGAWARLDSVWDYPTIIAGRTDNLGYPELALEQWQQVVAQGRDQFVKTVRKAFLCDLGHRASVVTITEREFRPNFVGMDGSFSIFGAEALLRQYQYIQVQEPVKDYEPLAPVYLNAGRELPFKRIHITTRTTPKIDVPAEDQPFWPTVGGAPFRFQMVAEDMEGKTVHFDRPLMCIPLRAVVSQASWNDQGPWQSILDAYHHGGAGEPSTTGLRTVDLRSQPVAFAKTSDGNRGKTTLNTQSMLFEAQLVEGGERISQLPNEHPLFLPAMAMATVSIPAIERLLGRPAPRVIRFDADYLSAGFSAATNKAEVFAELTPAFEMPFEAEKAGGLVKPDMAVEALSRAVGPVSNPAQLKEGKFEANAFKNARFLGGITLGDILENVANLDFGRFQEVDLPTDPDRLRDPAFRLEVPVLTSRQLLEGGSAPIAAETSFLWKPRVKDHDAGLFSFTTENDTQLILQSRMVTPFGGRAPTLFIDGRLERFSLNFVGAVKLTFSMLNFRVESGKKMDVSAEGLNLQFIGPLAFVQTLRDILPAEGFKDPPYIEVAASGIKAGYVLGVPRLGVGVFSLQNISLAAGLTLPFTNQPAGVRFSVSERQSPFLVTVGIFGGGGFFALALSTGGIEQIEAAIEFGGNISLNLGVASGGVYVMVGIYFGMTGNQTKLTGYLRCGGYLSVLGLISLSLEFYLALTYLEKSDIGGEAWGQAMLTVRIEIAFFSKSITLSIERRFAGAAGDPSFAHMVEADDWTEYCRAFA
jgi:hypothetical protein